MDLSPEHARTGRVERGDQRRPPAAGRLARIAATRCAISPAALFVNVTARICRGIHAAGHQVRDAVGDDAGLAAARARQDEQRAVHVKDRLLLHGVEPGEEGPDLGGLELGARLAHQASTRAWRAIRTGASSERSVVGRRRLTRSQSTPEAPTPGRRRARATRRSRSSRGSAADPRRSRGGPRRDTRGAGAGTDITIGFRSSLAGGTRRTWRALLAISASSGCGEGDQDPVARPHLLDVARACGRRCRPGASAPPPACPSSIRAMGPCFISPPA